MRVLMLQFLKGSWHYGELDAVQAFGDKFVMKQLGRGFVKVGAEKPDPEDVRMVEDAWAEADKAIHSGQWDLVILDEINYAVSYGMLDPAKVVESLQRKPEMVHDTPSPKQTDCRASGRIYETRRGPASGSRRADESCPVGTVKLHHR